MFRLLVVEDEEMIRNKILYNTNWKENGFIEVFEARDGYEALEIIKKNKIDIVITDIQMPKMNGIELVREIRKFDKRIRIVIITAYAEFEYAKESIALNVNDYILKPFKSKDLLVAVKKVMEGIVRESNERIEIETLRKQLRENRKALQDKLFNDLLSNSYVGNIDNDLSYLEMSNLKGIEYFTSVVNISNFMDIIHENDEEQKYICNLTLFNWINKFLSLFVMEQELFRDFGYQVINYKIDQIVIVFFNELNIVAPVLEELIERGNRDLGFNLTVGTGNKYQSLKDIHISYKEACSAAMLSSIYGKLIVYNFNDIIPGDKMHGKQLHIPVDTRLYDDLKIGAFQEIKKDIADIITEIKTSRLGPDAINTITNNIVLLSCKTINELGYNVFDIMGNDFSMSFDIKEIKDLFELQEWLLSFFFKVNEYINQKRNSRNETLISKVKEYIDTKYSENITLTSISRNFGISSGYLSVLFNDSIGQNFIDYLSNLRIKKAKELLKNTDLRIYEITEKVGYRDAYYFSAAFKKIVGINPTEYREKLNML